MSLSAARTQASGEITLPLSAPVIAREPASSLGRLQSATPVVRDTEHANPPAVEDEAAQKAKQEAELKKRFKDAEAEGYAEGLLKGQKEAKAAIGTRLKRLEEVAAALDLERHTLRAELEDAIVELTLSAILKILGEFPMPAERLRESVRLAIEKAGYLREPVTVRVAPADYELLAVERAGQEQSAESNLVRWEPDNRVALGGCILESPRGHLDLRLETRLERLKTAMLDIRRQRS